MAVVAAIVVLAVILLVLVRQLADRRLPSSRRES
jgi:hypothetical protein